MALFFWGHSKILELYKDTQVGSSSRRLTGEPNSSLPLQLGTQLTELATILEAYGFSLN